MPYCFYSLEDFSFFLSLSKEQEKDQKLPNSLTRHLKFVLSPLCYHSGPVSSFVQQTIYSLSIYH